MVSPSTPVTPVTSAPPATLPHQPGAPICHLLDGYIVRLTGGTPPDRWQSSNPEPGVSMCATGVGNINTYGVVVGLACSPTRVNNDLIGAKVGRPLGNQIYKLPPQSNPFGYEGFVGDPPTMEVFLSTQNTVRTALAMQAVAGAMAKASCH
jgi:hypothetical protein